MLREATGSEKGASYTRWLAILSHIICGIHISILTMRSKTWVASVGRKGGSAFRHEARTVPPGHGRAMDAEQRFSVAQAP